MQGFTCEQGREDQRVRLGVSHGAVVVLGDAGDGLHQPQQFRLRRALEHEQRNDRSQAGNGRQLVVIAALLVVKRLAGMRLRESSGVGEGVFGGMIAVVAASGRAEVLHKPPPEVAGIHPAQFGDGLQQEQRGGSVVGLVARLFARVVVVGGGGLEAVDAVGMEAAQLVEVVNLVGAKAEGVADELAPDRSAHAIGERGGVFVVQQGSRQDFFAHAWNLLERGAESSQAGRKMKCAKNRTAST